jgi:hypothetical protein
MSHLIIEQGKEVGREVTVPPAGMKFGHSPANDLVLEDDAVMPFHGRFFFKSDGVLWVTDFGAANQTTVGGVPVDEKPLKVGDLVEVGHTAFRIINSSLEDTDEAPAEAGIDLGFKKKSTRHVKTSFAGRLLQLTVILMVLIALLVVGPAIRNLFRSDVSAEPKEDMLVVCYERVVADTSNIFRYRLELTKDLEFSVEIDDLKHNRHVSKNKVIPKTMMLQLANGIDDAGFFDIGDDYSVDVPGQYHSMDVAITQNDRFHHVNVLNRTLPPAVDRVQDLLESFARSELGISFTWNMSAEELETLAKDAYALGQARYAERDVRYSNLAKAIKHYQEACLYLETIEPKPELFHLSRKGLEGAKAEQDLRYEEYMFQVEKAIRLKDWQTAARSLRILSDLISDRADERYDKINSVLLDVERRIKK